MISIAYVFVTILLLMAFLVFLHVLQKDRAHGYYWWQPTRIPLSFTLHELPVVKSAYDNRSPNDITFYNQSDRDMHVLFYDIIKEKQPKHTLRDIHDIIHNPHLLLLIVQEKHYYNRIRPYQLDATIIPPPTSSTYHTPSFPAGHAAQAYFTARVLAIQYPQLKDAFMNLALRIDHTRIRAGIHYPSDGMYARKMVDSLFLLL